MSKSTENKALEATGLKAIAKREGGIYVV